MIDHKHGEEPKKHSTCALRGQRKRFLVSILAALLGSCLLGFASYSRRPYTCSICRMGKVDHQCLGLKWFDQEETDCSLWYRSNVERSHSHAWVQCTYCRRFGIPGLSGGYACVIGGPITGLSRTVQMEIYRHFEDRLEAKKLFMRLRRDRRRKRSHVDSTDGLGRRGLSRHLARFVGKASCRGRGSQLSSDATPATSLTRTGIAGPPRRTASRSRSPRWPMWRGCWPG